MTENTGTQSKYTKTLMMTGTGVLALALLTGCSVAEPGTSEASDDTTATASSATAETSPATGGTDDQGSSESGSGEAGPGEATATVAGDDAVFAAIDALMAEHDGAIIVELDQDDDDTVYEIEAIVGDRIVDFDVTTDGTVREDDDDDDDDDDIRRAREADITAEEAARTVLEGRDGRTIDSMELDEEDGTLHWEVALDDEQGDDDDDLHVDAMTGEVRGDD